jgi:hypothetical protein
MVERMQNRRGITSASLAVALTGSSASGQTLTPTSYAPFDNAGYTSGQGTLIVQTLGVPASREVLLVTDFSVHPFPIERAQDGTAAVSHPIGADVAIAWTETSINAIIGIYQNGVLMLNTAELDLRGATVTNEDGVAVIHAAGGGTASSAAGGLPTALSRRQRAAVALALAGAVTPL